MLVAFHERMDVYNDLPRAVEAILRRSFITKPPLQVKSEVVVCIVCPCILELHKMLRKK